MRTFVVCCLCALISIMSCHARGQTVARAGSTASISAPAASLTLVAQAWAWHAHQAAIPCNLRDSAGLTQAQEVEINSALQQCLPTLVTRDAHGLSLNLGGGRLPTCLRKHLGWYNLFEYAPAVCTKAGALVHGP